MSCKVRNVVGNGIWEFGGCRALKSLTFSGENKAMVTGSSLRLVRPPLEVSQSPPKRT